MRSLSNVSVHPPKTANRWGRVLIGLAASAAIAVFAAPTALADTQSGDDSIAPAASFEDAGDDQDQGSPSPDPGVGDATEQDGRVMAPRGGADLPAPPPSQGATGEGEPGDEGREDSDDEDVAPEEAFESQSGFTPFAIPDAPLLTWEVKNAAGELVGGAQVQVQGPRSGSWGSTYTVTDCTEEPCGPGGDEDPTPGAFAVAQLGNHEVDSTNRYRMRQSVAPDGYFWTAAQAWRTLPGVTSTSNNPASGAWVNGAYDFGVLQVGSYMPVCEAGNIYAVNATGQLQHLDPSGNKINIGTSASNVSSFNSLGIGKEGEAVYAVERSGANANMNAKVWKFNVNTGTWAAEPGNGSYLAASGVGIVAGAVCFCSDNFFFGGFNSAGTEFHIWEYHTASQQISKKGYIDTSQGAGGTANGDMAFDSAGNLYVVRGTGTTSTIFSVTNANFAAASGTGLIPSAYNQSQTTVSNVNGVAFDSDGYIYLGQSTNVRRYEMPNWTGGNTDWSTQLTGSTDLASCDTPPSVTIEKNILGRVDDSHQFKLELKDSSGALLGDATTQGTDLGLQEERVGPLPTARGVTLDFSESLVGQGNLSTQYKTSWECKAYNNDGGVTDPNPYSLGSGTQTNGQVTIPSPSPELSSKKQIICTFTNSPLVAKINVNKIVIDKEDEEAPGVGWTVGASSTATSGAATLDPAVDTQQTGTDGSASWQVNFDQPGSSADLTVWEEQQGLHEFDRGECVVTDSNRNPGEPQTFTSEAGITLESVGPGERVDCTFWNRELTQTLELVKEVENTHGGDLTPADFPLNATPTGEGQSGLEFTSGQTQAVTSGSFIIGEEQQPGYELKNIVCVQDEGASFELDEDGLVTITDTDLKTVCTLTNSDQPGSVIWNKIATSGEELLAGSEWNLTGPGIASGGVSVTDCVLEGSGTCAAGDHKDQDPSAGKFKLEGLTWGEYALTETQAPAGYVLDTTTHTFTIGHDDESFALDINLGDFENAIREGPEMPLTGGLSSDAFLIAGGIAAGLGGLVATSIYRRRAARTK